MENLGEQSSKEAGFQIGRILNRDLFLFLLDLEVKRARRYQNFLCLLLFKIKPAFPEDCGESLESCYRRLSGLLIEEIRESDILGALEIDKLALLLPYADVKAGGDVQSRLEEALKYYGLKNKGVEVIIDQICFPTHGTDLMERIRSPEG